MAEKELTLNVFNDEHKNPIEIRHGDALPLREPVKVALSGNIDTVTRFLEKRVEKLDQKDCNIIICRAKSGPYVKLTVAESSFFSGSVTGKIMLTDDFIEFGINMGKKYTLRELSDFIKMHRYCFQDSSTAMKLVAELRNFKAKVNKEIEKLGDNRGNKNEVLSQVVDTNIPESFTLDMIIFKGSTKSLFKVDININVRDTDMDCQLESVEANDLLKQHLDDAINNELATIDEIAPDIVQIEI